MVQITVTVGAGRTTERIKILNGKIISFEVCRCFNVLLSTQREACNGFPPEIEYYILRSLTIETLWAFLSDTMARRGKRESLLIRQSALGTEDSPRNAKSRKN